MKNLSKSFTFLFVAVFLIIPANQSFAQRTTHNSIEGIWVGKLEIPGAATLRIGIIVKEDGSAELNIIDQATGNIPIDEVSYLGDGVTFILNKLGITIKGRVNADKDAIESEFMQRDRKFALHLSLVDELPKLIRPQTPKAPFGYTSREVEIENKKANITLQGTLTLPKSKTKVPAVILLTGSGQQGRDQDIAGHKPFWVIADYLSENGIAVLRMDDRGIGGSTGDFNRSTTGDFASDALAAVAYLKKCEGIDLNHIGLLGHSEGGSTAAIAACQSNDVKFIISLSGGIVNFGNIVIQQISDRLKLQNVPEENIELEMQWRRTLYEIVREPIDSSAAAEKMWHAYRILPENDIKAMNWPEGRMNHMVSQLLSPWWRYILSLDVISLYKKITCPALLLYGSKDMQVNAKENYALMEEAIKPNKKSNITIQIIEGVNHLYQTAGTGSEYEYVQIEETISPEVLKLISEWIINDTH
ncbi:alpha/beta hydrolase family protein [Aestuariivivens sediminis]|uniref:alpha/beta hydrolase family protein n=1 Tax=Aestuariivivens sediminis TaxID=2913557 RepID=UPI001F592D32|nr:alpha/beta fold hydrolase [Aestuariivivens sediminis]